MEDLVKIVWLTIIIVIVIIMVVFAINISVYNKTIYHSITKNSYFNMRFNLGNYGEFLIYKYLSKLKGDKRFLFNCYVPKSDGGTSEIDVIMIHSSGIYVFESKNYSGWIFGTETQKAWTQSLKNGRKVQFYNPLMQNSTHIKWLNRFLGDIPTEYFHSIIVFSERCVLKKINLTSKIHIVVRRDNLYREIAKKSEPSIFSVEKIDDIFHRLISLSKISKEEKARHIASIQKNEYKS